MNFAQKSLAFVSLARSNFQAHWHSFWAYLPLRIHLFLWLISFFICCFLSYSLYSQLDQDNINLHYNILFGTDLIGSPARLYFLPASTLLIGLVNLLLSVYLLKYHRLLAYLTAGSAIIINILVALGIYSLYLINFVNLF